MFDSRSSDGKERKSKALTQNLGSSEFKMSRATFKSSFIVRTLLSLRQEVVKTLVSGQTLIAF